jgi:hypothetical protein
MQSIPRGYVRKAQLLAGLILLVFLAGAADAQTVTIDPAVTQPTTLHFEVGVAMDTQGLSVLGMEIRINFVSSVVHLDSITPGSWVTSSGYNYFFYDHSPSGPGFQAHFALAMLDGLLNGSGTVAVMHFTVLDVGVSPLNFMDVDVRGQFNDNLGFTGTLGNLILISELPPSAVDEQPALFRLENYPNPFNPMTMIGFNLPEAARVDLTIFTLEGRRITTLLDEEQSAGYHTVVWNGRGDDGMQVATGTYLCRILAGPYCETRKMSLMK